MTTMRVGAAINKSRISRKPNRDTIARLKEYNETYLKKVWHPKRASYVMVDVNTGNIHEIPKEPNILDEILEDYWESVCDFVEPHKFQHPPPCHKAESIPPPEWIFTLKENTRLLAVKDIGHLDQYGTQFAGYMAPLGCRLQWVSEMR